MTDSPHAPYLYAHAPRLERTGPIDVRSLTKSDLPIEIEIGPGRGAFILERAAEATDRAIVGLEIRAKWATIVDERLARHGFGERARVFAEDAKFLLPRLQPSGSIKSFFVHFPDPWWKKRQQKRLVMVGPIADEIVRLLEPGGMLFVQTDVPDRAEGYEDVLRFHDGLVPDGDEPGSARISSCPWESKSNREKRVIEAGLEAIRLRYKRR